MEDTAISPRLTYPRIVVSSQTRALLMQVISDLVDDDSSLLPSIVRSLDQLVPCEKSEDDDSYHYELSQMFERDRALRAPCGYVGLRNLSNTCYFNSLFTQLFMNVPFRQFMMNVDVRDDGDTQNLLFQTRVLFGFLQDSVRRYVDTQLCVGSVKTYDDTTIDIHNQMDVDEFYNLLFDRWEGQLLSEEDKKTFRSFFGGQIVQQVRSKECEHVSERLEPFSAIQCDIKGKTSLQESLRAYVEGEIMDGGTCSASIF
jgi:ubiquitin carboxyl-terminal hydrolase 34